MKPSTRLTVWLTALVLISLGGAFIVGKATTAPVAGYWEKHGKTYYCYGDNVRVFCKETNWKPAYEVGILNGLIATTFQGKLIFSCKRGIRPGNNCSYFGP